MKNIIFIEGVSGVGKSTMVKKLGETLKNAGYSVECYYEGDIDNPLDLCWVAYLGLDEFNEMLKMFSFCEKEIKDNIVFQGSYVLVQYKKTNEFIFTEEVTKFMKTHEFCFRPSNPVSIKQFTKVFEDRWEEFANRGVFPDYCLFDGALVSHMASDLLRNYNASLEQIKKHIKRLQDKINMFNPLVIYLSSDNVEQRLIEARNSRGQMPPSDEQILFWKKRKETDLKLLEDLEIEAYIMDVSERQWDIAQEETYNNLMENIYVMGNKANYDWLMESKAQLESGNISTHNLIEVEADE